MKKYSLLSLFLIVFTSFSSLVHAGKTVLVEEAIESASLNIKISRDLTGIVRGKVCDRCETIVVNITPETKLFIKGEQADLSRAASRSGKPGTAVFNIKTRKVTKIYSD